MPLTTTITRKRTSRRRFRRKMVRRKKRTTTTRVFTCNQTVVPSLISSSNTIGVETNYSFALSDIPQVATFTALFDQYRINKITAKFFPRGDNNPSGSTNASKSTIFYMCTDSDDIGSIGSAGILQRANLKYDSAVKPRTITFVPRAANTVYNTPLAAYGIAKPGMWLDIATTSVPHYGLRTYLGTTASNSDISYDVIFKYNVSFKDVR